MIRTFCTHKIRKVRELSGSLWEFSPCTGDLTGRKYRTAVPCCWESMPDFSSYRGVGVFSREIETEGAFRLVFKGVSHTARVCLDGREIGSHYNAYTPFTVAVTDVMAGRHLLEVYADNTFGDVYKRQRVLWGLGPLWSADNSGLPAEQQEEIRERCV